MISDAALKEAASAVNQAMLDALPNPENCTHVFSPRFERKMRKLIRRVKHPIIYKTLNRVACALIVLILSAGLFLTFHTEARAAVVDWIKEKVEDFYHYFAPEQGQEAAIPGEYCLGWIPEGYELLFSENVEGSKTEYYRNDAGQILQFHCLYHTSYSSLLVGGGEYDEKYIVTEKLEASIHLSKGSNNSNGIVWYVGNGNTLLHISANLEEEDLIKIAENAYLQENN